jgi:hypothetical protein
MAELVSWKGKHLFSQLPHQVIYADASDWGWGATLDMYQDDTTHGWFQGPKLREHINYKEAEAVVESILYYQSPPKALRRDGEGAKLKQA